MPAQTRSPHTILIVDDDRSTRDLLRIVVSGVFGELVNIYDAENGQAALEMIAMSGQPDLVISDGNMPRMGGLQLLRELQVHGFDLIFGLVTADLDIDERVAKDVGAHFFIRKPFDVAEVERILRAFDQFKR